MKYIKGYWIKLFKRVRESLKMIRFVFKERSSKFEFRFLLVKGGKC